MIMVFVESANQEGEEFTEEESMEIEFLRINHLEIFKQQYPNLDPELEMQQLMYCHNCNRPFRGSKELQMHLLFEEFEQLLLDLYEESEPAVEEALD